MQNHCATLIDMLGISKGKSNHMIGAGSSMKKKYHAAVHGSGVEIKSNRKQEKKG